MDRARTYAFLYVSQAAYYAHPVIIVSPTESLPNSENMSHFCVDNKHDIQSNIFIWLKSKPNFNESQY